MCCWWVPKDRQQNIDSGSYRALDVTMMTASNDTVSDMPKSCSMGSIPCPPTSKEALYKCLNGGICCVPENSALEYYCKCFNGYDGERCNKKGLYPVILSGEQVLNAVAAVSILFIVFAVILLLLVALCYVRSRKRLQQESKVLTRGISLPAAESQPTNQQTPGLSWREISVKRQASRTISSSVNNISSNFNIDKTSTSPPIFVFASKEPRKADAAP